MLCKEIEWICVIRKVLLFYFKLDTSLKTILSKGKERKVSLGRWFCRISRGGNS